jgi:hypothetical protein
MDELFGKKFPKTQKPKNPPKRYELCCFWGLFSKKSKKVLGGLLLIRRLVQTQL